MYKLINDMVDINVHQQFRPSNTTTRGHHQRFLQLPTRVDAYMNSFFPFTIKLWNQPAAEEVVDMRGGWADPDLFL